MPVSASFANLEDGADVARFIEWFAGVTEQQAREVLDHAAKSALPAACACILFDRGTPVPLRRALEPHDVETAYERGWATLTNGELLATAERKGFDE